jgi:hypothetical protein
LTFAHFIEVWRRIHGGCGSGIPFVEDDSTLEGVSRSRIAAVISQCDSGCETISSKSALVPAERLPG